MINLPLYRNRGLKMVYFHTVAHWVLVAIHEMDLYQKTPQQYITVH